MVELILDRLALDEIGSLIVMLNAGILAYKTIRGFTDKPFTIPVAVFIYLLLSVLFFLYSVTLGALYFGSSQSSPGMAVGNTIVVFWILTSPTQWSQYVKGRDAWARLLKNDSAMERRIRQP